MKWSLLVFIVFLLVACTSAAEEPALTESESEPTAVPEVVVTEEPTVAPEPTAPPEPTATPVPPTPVPTETPVPAETPIPTRTPHPKGRVKGCIYWTDGSLAEGGYLSFSNERGIVQDLREVVAIGGCFNIVVSSGQYGVNAGLSNRSECGPPALCGSPLEQIDVPPDGIVEIDFYPVPRNQD